MGSEGAGTDKWRIGMVVPIHVYYNAFGLRAVAA